MKIEVNVEKKYVFLIVGAILFLGVLVVVYALTPWDNSKNVWHNANDVKVNVNGFDYSLQNAVNDGLLKPSETITLAYSACTDGSGPLFGINYCSGSYPIKSYTSPPIFVSDDDCGSNGDRSMYIM